MRVTVVGVGLVVQEVMVVVTHGVTAVATGADVLESFKTIIESAFAMELKF